MPVNPSSTAQQAVRSRLGTNAASWRTLTANQRQGWESLGAQMQRTDALGQTYTLNGFAAFCSVNNNLSACGENNVTDAPALTSPTPIDTVTLTLTPSSFSVAFTPTPLATGEKVMVYASPQRAAGRTYESDYRLIFVGAAATASPSNILAGYSARFGAPVSGNRINVAVATHSDGFRSASVPASGVVA